MGYKSDLVDKLPTSGQFIQIVTEGGQLFANTLKWTKDGLAVLLDGANGEPEWCLCTLEDKSHLVGYFIKEIMH